MRVTFESVAVVDVGGGDARIPQRSEGFGNFTEPALAKDVKLMQAHVLGRVHVKVNRRKALRRHKCGRPRGERRVGDENSARMQRHAVRKPMQQASVAKDAAGCIVAVAQLAVGQFVDVGFGQTPDFAEFANHSAVLKGADGSEQCRVRKPLKNVLRQPRAVAPRKVDVEVGGRTAVEVDESLKVKI